MANPTSIVVDGAAGRLHLTDFGGEGPVVLALHGVTGGAFLWAGVAREMAGRARIIALDFRGHGRSDWSQNRAYDTADHVADLQLVFDQVDFGPKPPVIIGSSWGALAAIALLSDQPDLADQLMIVDVEPSFTTSETEVFARPYRFPDLGAALDWERRANPHAPKGDLADFTRASVVETVEGHVLRRHDPFFLTRWPFRKDDLWQELAGLAQQVSILHGSDSFVRREICERMAQLNPAWRFTPIANSGHLVPLEQPKAVAEELAVMIQSVRLETV